MTLKKLLIALSTSVVLLTSTTAFAFESKIVDEFWEAQTRHASKRYAVIKENRQKVPGEIDALFDTALRPGTPEKEREALFDVIDRMANAYGRVTGDKKYVSDVKKRMFESRLDSPVSLASVEGVHVVESVVADGEGASFSPDNIIIRVGDTVRWVNKGVKALLIKSILTDAGEAGIDSPMLEKGQSWERRLYRPGEYYYMAFSGKAMYGKITVVEGPREQADLKGGTEMMVKAEE